MSADREAVATTGSASAGVPVPASVMAVMASHAASTGGQCANCGTAITGHFCAHCGQKNENPLHSLWHFIGEATEDLTHADSRVWITIGALLFKPGFLTLEFLAGRRARYLPPIRLYLVMSVLFFLFAALTPHHQMTPAERAQIAREVRGHEYVAIGDPNIKSPAERHEHARQACGRMDAKLNASLGSGVILSSVKTVAHKGCLSLVEDNGHALAEAFMHNLPRALFITLPIMAALMKLLYRRPPRYYVEHLLFLLHNYSFVFLWAATFVLLSWMIASDAIMDPLLWVFFLYALYYFFRGMRRVYPEGVARTLVKFTGLSFGYLVVVGTAVVATGVYSVLAQ